MESIWQRDVTPKQRPRLTGDLHTDVLIIGGGLAGILCAYRLQRAGVRCVVLEADRIGGGTTACTTAKISAGHGLIYAKLAERFGTERAGLYWRAQKRALRAYRALSRDIDCDFEQRDGYVYLQHDRAALEREQRTLERIGADTVLTDSLPLPFGVAGAIRYPHEAQFHPLKLLYALADVLEIYEHSRVLDIEPHRACTVHGTVAADKIIVATHFPFLNRHGAYFLKQYQYRSYILALKNAPDLNGMYVDGMGNAPSFRNYGELLLLGGGGHRTGMQGGAWQSLRDFGTLHYPGATEVAHFATQDCMTLDDMPYVGRYGRRTPELYVATGFCKWGMTGSMTAAMLLEEIILEKPTPYADLFDPARPMLCKQLGSNVLHATAGLLFPSRRRCSHLGCALKWNPGEHTFDCPCHGSRFHEDGKLLNGPANKSLKHKRP